VNTTKQSLNLLLIDNSFMGYMQEQFGRFLYDRSYNITWFLMSSDFKKDCKSQKFGFAEVISSPKLRPTGRLSRLINYIFYKPYMSFLLPNIIRSRNIDIVLVRNDVRIALLTYLLCKLKHIPFVHYLAYPLLESNRLSVRQGHRKNRFINELAAIIGIPLRNWVTRKADLVFTMSDYWAKQIINELRLPARKVMSLPAGFDPTIQPNSSNSSKVRLQYNLENYPTLFYMGSIVPPRETKILSEIIKRVVQHIPDVRLLMLCGQNQNKHIASFQKDLIENGVENNVVFASTVPHDQVSMYINASHVGLSPIETIPIFNVSSPHKFIEMLGQGCPVVASEIPDQKYMICNSGGGICVPYDVESFSNAIIYLLNNQNIAKKMGQRGRDFAIKERSYDVLAKRIDVAIRHLF